MIKFLPVLLLIISACSNCEGDWHDTYHSDYILILKTKSDSVKINEIRYQNSGIKLLPKTSITSLPVSYFKAFQVFVSSDIDSGYIQFFPQINSNVSIEVCEKKRDFTFTGFKFNSKNYPNSIIKRFSNHSYNVYERNLTVDTLILLP